MLEASYARRHATQVITKSPRQPVLSLTRRKDPFIWSAEFFIRTHREKVVKVGDFYEPSPQGAATFSCQGLVALVNRVSKSVQTYRTLERQDDCDRQIEAIAAALRQTTVVEAGTYLKLLAAVGRLSATLDFIIREQTSGRKTYPTRLYAEKRTLCLFK